MVGNRSWRCVLPILALSTAALACHLENASDNTPQYLETKPLVLLLAPVNGSTYAEGIPVEFHAIAQDAGAGVARVEFRVDDIPVGEVAAANPDGQPSLAARITWVAADKRGHLVTVEAFRADGSSLGLSDVTIKVTDRPTTQFSNGGTAVTPPTDVSGPGPSTPVPTATPDELVASPPLTGAGAAAGPVARAAVAGLNVRQGPGTDYPAVGTLLLTDRVPVVGRSADSSWWAIAYAGGTAWTFAELTIVEGDVSQVPLVAAPPP